MPYLFGQVTIIGVGLLGGSLARLMKEKALTREITGAGRSRQTLELALRLGVIDRIDQGLAKSVEHADLVVLAAPVGSFESIAREIAPHLKAGAIVTDVGSVKGALVHALESILPVGVHYVPGHPIAGKEKFGVAESTAALFVGAKCILTPTSRTDKQSLDRVREMWDRAGAKIHLMTPELHDKIFAAVSHLPHVAAFAMMAAVEDLKTDTDDYVSYSGAGFRDFTRIAGSSPEIWRDICLLNGDNILQMLDRYLFALNRFKREIIAGDPKKLERRLASASNARRGLG